MPACTPSKFIVYKIDWLARQTTGNHVHSDWLQSNYVFSAARSYHNG